MSHAPKPLPPLHPGRCPLPPSAASSRPAANLRGTRGDDVPSFVAENSAGGIVALARWIRQSNAASANGTSCLAVFCLVRAPGLGTGAPRTGNGRPSTGTTTALSVPTSASGRRVGGPASSREAVRVRLAGVSGCFGQVEARTFSDTRTSRPACTYGYVSSRLIRRDLKQGNGAGSSQRDSAGSLPAVGSTCRPWASRVLRSDARL